MGKRLNFCGLYSLCVRQKRFLSHQGCKFKVKLKDDT